MNVLMLGCDSSPSSTPFFNVIFLPLYNPMIKSIDSSGLHVAIVISGPVTYRG